MVACCDVPLFRAVVVPLRVPAVLVQSSKFGRARGPLVLEKLRRPLDVMSKPVRDLLFSFQDLRVFYIERVMGLRGKSPVSRRRVDGVPET